MNLRSKFRGGKTQKAGMRVPAARTPPQQKRAWHRATPDPTEEFGPPTHMTIHPAKPSQLRALHQYRHHHHQDQKQPA